MANLTKNISREEVSCKCGCGFNSMDGETLDVWQGACDHFASVKGLLRVVLVVHSGARCFDYNRTPVVGSNDNSQHPLARAIDGHIPDVSPQNLYNYFDRRYQGKFGLGLYPTFVHLDTKSGVGRRWVA